MFPQLVTIGSLSISSFGASLVAAFVVGTFMVWRQLRDAGISDERIFDQLLLTGGAVLIGSRLFFAATHNFLFAENWLRIFLVWRFPGLSFWGALIFVMVFGTLFAHKQKLSLPLVFDGYAKAVPYLVVLIGLGVFLDGSVAGGPTAWPFGIETGLIAGKRHPVGAYAAAVGIFMLPGSFFINRLIVTRKLPKSVLGWATLSALGMLQLGLAFARADLLYFEGISLELLLAAALTVGPWGPLFVLLDGPAFIRGSIKYMAKFRQKPI